MRPPKPPPPDTRSPEYVQGLIEFARSRGLDRVGVTHAGILERSRVALVDRRERGLADTMGFTFRDPERSTDPTRAVDGARSILVGALSYALDDVPDGTPDDAVSGYAGTDGDFTPAHDPNISEGDGNVFSSFQDLALYEAWLTENGMLPDFRPIFRNGTTDDGTPIDDGDGAGYGYGWSLAEMDGSDYA